MDGTLILKKYSIFKDGAELLSVDLSAERYSFGEYRQIFLDDYLNITQTLSGQTISSSFLFQIFQDQIKIDKDHIQSKVEVYENDEKKDEDFFSLISTKLGIKIDQNVWKNRFIQSPEQDNLKIFVEKLNSSLINTQELSALENDIFSNKEEGIVKKIRKYIELKQKEDSIETEVNNYKSSKDEIEKLKLEISNLEKGNKSSQDMYDSLKSLISSKSELEEAIKKYENYKTPIPEGEKLDEIERRYNELFEQKKVPQNVSKSLNNAVKNTLRGRGIVVMFFVQILLTSLFFILSQNLLILILGAIIILELLVSLAVINYFSPNDFDQSIVEIEPEINISQQRGDNSQRYVNSAIYSSLEQEYRRVLEAIEKRLKGKSLETLSLEINQSKRKHLELQEKLGKAPSKLSQDEYYKLRRELDILKIEVEGIEYDKSLNLDLEKLRKYLNILKVKNTNILPIIINGDLPLKDNFIKLI